MRHFNILLILLTLSATMQAEVIRLKTGKVVEGDILLQNEHVVVLRDRSGAKYQYPMSEVERIGKPGDTEFADVPAAVETKPIATTSGERKAMFRFELAGGMGTIDKAVGGSMSADMLVGSRRLAGRELMIGGGVGYHGYWADGRSMHFLPIQVAMRYTLLEQTHSPYIGVGIGYGVALSKDYVGGIYSGLDLGYRYLTPKKHKQICVGIFGTVQGCSMTADESIPDEENTTYQHAHAGRILGQVGVKISFGL